VGGSATVSATAGSTTLGPSAERANALDLATLLKASQAIAGEIVLERLLVKLMDIIRENAGAESVVLILESNGEFLVQGVKTAGGAARVLAAEPLRLSVVCSTGIVNYVLRTSRPSRASTGTTRTWRIAARSRSFALRLRTRAS
jgi:hypothetical protein